MPEVLFDVNGDGVIDDVTETFAATFTAPSTFTVTIPATSGPAGTRTLTAVAFDPSDNPGVANIKINVGSVAPVTVPNVVNQAEAAATAAITSAGLDVGDDLRARPHRRCPWARSISQNPAAGTVALFWNPGEPRDLDGGQRRGRAFGLSVCRRAAASSAITAAGLVVGIVTHNFPTSDPPNTVLGQGPAAAVIVASGSAVALLVSQAVGGVTVPNVVGLTQARRDIGDHWRRIGGRNRHAADLGNGASGRCDLAESGRREFRGLGLGSRFGDFDGQHGRTAGSYERGPHARCTARQEPSIFRFRSCRQHRARSREPVRRRLSSSPSTRRPQAPSSR